MEIQKWEYKTFVNTWSDKGFNLQNKLNDLGAESWELICVIAGDYRDVMSKYGSDPNMPTTGGELPNDTVCQTFVFKRPAQLPSNIVFTSDLKKTTEDNVPGGLA